MTLTILSLEDEAEVRQALERDLEEFDDGLYVFPCTEYEDF